MSGLIAHHVIDALNGRGSKLELYPGVTRDLCRDVATAISKAEKFDFGDLALERAHDDDSFDWVCPSLTIDERQWWSEGLLPLPAPICWYEFVIGRCRSGLLVIDRGDAWSLYRIDVTQGNLVNFIGVQVRAKLAQADSDNLMATLHGNTTFIQLAEKNNPELMKHEASNMRLAMYLTLMLNSKSTEIAAGPTPPAKLNAARIKRGAAPLPVHRIVRIVPDRFREDASTPAVHGQPRRPPRLHWRRSHVRTLATGKKVLIARMLVGRADLGHVSHEYKIERAD